jgi:PAS domain S-box-containing protein
MCQFQEFVESVTDVIYWTDAQGRITFVNRATAQMMKCRERDLLGRSYLEFAAPSHLEATAAFYRTQLRERRAHSYFELPIVNAVGETLWLAQRARTVFDDAGTIVGFQTVAHDITPWKAIEQDRERLITELQIALAGLAPAALSAA